MCVINWFVRESGKQDVVNENINILFDQFVNKYWVQMNFLEPILCFLKVNKSRDDLAKRIFTTIKLRTSKKF